MTGLFPATAGERREKVCVVNHGWHTGLILPADRLPPSLKPQWASARGCRYVEFGWGDDGYYRADQARLGLMVRAGLGLNLTVMHVVAVHQDLAAEFPGSDLLQVSISAEGHRRLCAYLLKSYAADGQNRPIELGKGLYGDSRFFRANGRFYFPNMCNRWTARALRSTGAPITPFYAVGAGNVMWQVRRMAKPAPPPTDE